MRYVRETKGIYASIFALLLFSACSAKEEPAYVELQIEGDDASGRRGLGSVDGKSLVPSGGASSFGLPSSGYCYAVHVNGPHPDLARVDGGKLRERDGEGCVEPRNLGIFKGFFAHGKSTSIEVPAGPDRQFDIVAIPTPSGGDDCTGAAAVNIKDGGDGRVEILYRGQEVSDSLVIFARGRANLVPGSNTVVAKAVPKYEGEPALYGCGGGDDKKMGIVFPFRTLTEFDEGLDAEVTRAFTGVSDSPLRINCGPKAKWVLLGINGSLPNPGIRKECNEVQGSSRYASYGNVNIFAPSTVVSGSPTSVPFFIAGFESNTAAEDVDYLAGDIYYGPRYQQLQYTQVDGYSFPVPSGSTFVDEQGNSVANPVVGYGITSGSEEVKFGGFWKASNTGHFLLNWRTPASGTKFFKIGVGASANEDIYGWTSPFVFKPNNSRIDTLAALNKVNGPNPRFINGFGGDSLFSFAGNLFKQVLRSSGLLVINDLGLDVGGSVKDLESDNGKIAYSTGDANSLKLRVGNLALISSPQSFTTVNFLPAGGAAEQLLVDAPAAGNFFVAGALYESPSSTRLASVICSPGLSCSKLPVRNFGSDPILDMAWVPKSEGTFSKRLLAISVDTVYKLQYSIDSASLGSLASVVPGVFFPTPNAPNWRVIKALKGDSLESQQVLLGGSAVIESNSRAVLYRSWNGGDQWTRVYVGPVNTSIGDIVQSKTFEVGDQSERSGFSALLETSGTFDILWQNDEGY
jgi:hypothetical protein